MENEPNLSHNLTTKPDVPTSNTTRPATTLVPTRTASTPLHPLSFIHYLDQPDMDFPLNYPQTQTPNPDPNFQWDGDGPSEINQDYTEYNLNNSANILASNIDFTIAEGGNHGPNGPLETGAGGTSIDGERGEKKKRCGYVYLVISIGVWVLTLGWLAISIIGICSMFIDRPYFGVNMGWGMIVPLFIVLPLVLIGVGTLLSVLASRGLVREKGGDQIRESSWGDHA